MHLRKFRVVELFRWNGKKTHLKTEKQVQIYTKKYYNLTLKHFCA